MLDTIDKQLITAIQDGLPLTSHPYTTIAQQINQTEESVIQRLKKLQLTGIIKRFGVVVKHRELGFRANAMVVWNIPDSQVNEIAQLLADFDCVTLCYQRPRRLPEWPYNLFTMIHGKDRKSVLIRLEELVHTLKLQQIKYEPLFSTKQFKQRGGRYLNDHPKAEKILSFNSNPLKQTHISQSKNCSPLLKPIYG
jgi:siroheme decarboxylase